MPPPVILLTALMIGYPLLQILATVSRRGKRLRFNAAAAELLSDPRLGHDDQNVVRRLMDASRGGLRTLKILFLVPTTAFFLAFDGDPNSHRPEAETDPANAIAWLRDQSTGLEMAAHPIGTALAVPVAFAAWTLGACVALLKGAAKPSRPSFYSVVRAATSSKAVSLTSHAS